TPAKGASGRATTVSLTRTGLFVKEERSGCWFYSFWEKLEEYSFNSFLFIRFGCSRSANGGLNSNIVYKFHKQYNHYAILQTGRRLDTNMPTTFEDHFSQIAASYAQYRPQYPPTLYAYLAQNAPGRALAWDCATGNGQAALGLAAYFDQVIATDASAEQI